MTQPKYPLIIRLFHWSMALIMIGLLILGFLMEEIFTESSFTGAMYAWHKSFGVLALILIAMRLWARLSLKRSIPPLTATLSRLEQLAATVGHKLLYLLMVLVPLTGYLMSSAYPKTSNIALFGLPLPEVLPKNADVAHIFSQLHTVFSCALAAVIALHIGAVIKHRYFDKHEQDIVKRMW